MKEQWELDDMEEHRRRVEAERKKEEHKWVFPKYIFLRTLLTDMCGKTLDVIKMSIVVLLNMDFVYLRLKFMVIIAFISFLFTGGSYFGNIPLRLGGNHKLFSNNW